MSETTSQTSEVADWSPPVMPPLPGKLGEFYAGRFEPLEGFEPPPWLPPTEANKESQPPKI